MDFSKVTFLGRQTEPATSPPQSAMPEESGSNDLKKKFVPVGLLNSAEAAEYLGLAEGTLIKERSTRTMGLPFVKIGRSVRYRLEDLDKFIAANVCNA